MQRGRLGIHKRGPAMIPKLITLALFLTACNFGVVEVAPETRPCYETSVTVNSRMSVRHIDTLECRTGKVVTKWVWE